MATPKKDLDVSEVIAGCFVLPLMIPAVVVIDGVLVSRLWSWFVEPTFHGAPHISMPIAAGLSLPVGWARGSRPDPKADERTAAEQVRRSFTLTVCFPLLLLFIGWTVKAVWL